MSYQPKLDLSKYDLITASEKLFAAVCEQADNWGFDPGVECALLTAEQSRALGLGAIRRVVWESGPHYWGVYLSQGGVTFAAYDGPWDMEHPEIITGERSDWYLEPYYGFDVGFVSDDIHADFENSESEIITNVNATTKFFLDELMKKLQNNPDKLKTINRRVFEELIAEIFYGFGYDVELTKQTRDGGKDIIAIKKIDSINTRLLIECKRPEPCNKIRVAAVRELLGVSSDDPATKAILVTTTSFSKDARYFLDRHKWVLEGKEYDDIVRWINDYNAIKSK